MPLRGSPRRYWPILVVSFLFVAALAASLFFHGFQVEYFGLTQVLLVIWLVNVVWRGHDNGFTVPKTILVFTVTLFWVWLAVTLIWSRVPAVSILNFWWLGSLPLVFWLYTLTSDREQMWRYASFSALILGLMLALMATYQLLILHQSPLSVFLNINSHAALLNLIALPVAGYFLLAAKGHNYQQKIVLGIALFILVFAVAITRGRGATLALLAGFAVVLATSWRYVAKKELAVLLALLGAAFVLGNLVSHGAVLDRLGTLESPASAGASRFIIWQQAWELLKASPWWGVGLGTFSLAFPPYRHPDDASGGYYVHNDYLQIWIEAGLPGLILLLAIFATALWIFIKTVKKVDCRPEIKIEMTGLFAGLLAIAAHAFLDFNFYIMTILMISGLILARFHLLAIQAHGAVYWTFYPAKIISAPIYRALTVLLSLFPIIYFAAIGLSGYEYQKALHQAEQGDLKAADESLSRAQHLAPASANIFMTHADLYRHLLAALPVSSGRERRALFTEARELLKQAEAMNPLQVQVFVVRGQLYQQNFALAGKNWAEQVAQNYAHALKLNPRFYPARLIYAQFLLERGDRQEARQLLEDGMRHWYFPSEMVLPYYLLTAKLRFQAGEKEQAKLLQQKIEEILLANGWTRTSRPAQPKVKLTH